ncbi:MAG: multicomponent Na+:H+ antiporter subunit B [Gammaproteobacteria bacterium]|jgi:multicomponent Na+:H+ antiporter subunit B
MTVIFGFFLLTLLLITAVAIVQSQNLFVSVMLSGMFSLLLAVNFFLLDAADVALTEAAVGAGISTVLLLSALAITAKHEKAPSSNRVGALIIVIIATLVLIYATFDNPRFADPNAPVHQHVAPWYFDKTAEAIDIPNVVTAVLGSFRGYDTLGEVFVVFTAGIGVLFLLGTPPGPFAQSNPYKPTDPKGLRHYLIPRIVGRMLIPFILLFGLYVQFHGEYGPGGGFQAGALIAAAIILFALLEGEDHALKVIPRSVLIGLIAGGALLYGVVGLFGIFLGSNFLDYSVLSSNPVKGQQMGLMLIEAGVGITVTGVLLSIFHAFAARGKF